MHLLPALTLAIFPLSLALPLLPRSPGLPLSMATSLVMPVVQNVAGSLPVAGPLLKGISIGKRGGVEEKGKTWVEQKTKSKRGILSGFLGGALGGELSPVTGLLGGLTGGKRAVEEQQQEDKREVEEKEKRGGGGLLGGLGGLGGGMLGIVTDPVTKAVGGVIATPLTQRKEEGGAGGVGDPPAW